MSYEGYEVRYCAKGHLLGQRDVYDFSPLPESCPVCGCTEFVEDGVDQTNGCFCDELPEGEECPCHATELTQVGWDPIQCPTCEGSGIVQHPSQHLPKPCECEGKDPCCEKCYGTGRVMVPSLKVTSDCDSCKSSGSIYVKRFDIGPLKRDRED